MLNYLVKQLQRVPSYAAGHVLGGNVSAANVANLSWLPMLVSIEYNISKLTNQGLNDKNWSYYLPAEIVTQKRTLRSNNSGHVLIMVVKIHFKINLKAFLT